MEDQLIKANGNSVDTLEEDSSSGSPEAMVRQKKDLATLWLLWAHRRFIARFTDAGLILSLIVAFLIPKRFESIARLMPPDQTGPGTALLGAALSTTAGSGAASGSGLASSLGPSLGNVASGLLGMKNTGDLFVGILESRSVEDDVISHFDLRKVYWDRYMNDARKDLENYTDISTDRKSGIITIKVTDKDPRRAAAMAQEYVEQLNRVLSRVNTTAAHRERIFLEDRLVQVRQDLEKAETGFSEFASKNTALDIPAQGKAMIEAAATLEGELVGAQTELQGVKQIYSDNNVRVRSLQARVEEIRRQLEKLGGKFDSAPDLNDQGDVGMYPSIRKLPLLGVNYADLYRNTKVEEAAFESLTAEYELAKVEEAKETPTAKIIDDPDVPERKSFPPRLLIAFLGMLVALSGAAAWVVGKSYWDNTKPNNPKKLFAREVFASVKGRLGGISGNGFGSGVASREVHQRESEAGK